MTTSERIIGDYISKAARSHGIDLARDLRLLAATNIMNALISTQISAGHATDESLKNLAELTVRALTILEGTSIPKAIAANHG